MKNLKLKFEFAYEGSLYKISKVLDDNKFLAIWIGRGLGRDLTTYNGYVKNGDFRTDNELFQVDEKGNLTLIQEATGILRLKSAKPEYLEAIF